VPIYYCYPTTYEGGSKYSGDGAAIDDTFGAWDDDMGYKERSFSALSSPGEGRWYFSAFLPFATSINSVTIGHRGRRAGGGVGTGVDVRSSLRVNGTNYYDSFNTNGVGYSNIEKVYTTNPNTSAAWQVSEMPGRSSTPLSGGVSSQNSDALDGRKHRLTGVWLKIDYAGLSALTESVRDAGSRRLWDWRKAKQFIRITVPIHVGLEVNAGDPFWVEHLAGAHPTDEGWRAKVWQLRGTVVYEKTVRPADGTVELVLRDRRSHLCLYRYTGWSIRSSSPLGIGIAAHGLGAARTLTRVGDAWVLDPGSKLFVKRLDGEPLYTEGGEAFVEAETNYLVQSAFKNMTGANFDGWTKSGTTADATIAEDTSRLLWDAANTGVSRCALFTASNPIMGADLELIGTATASFAANTTLWLVAWYEMLTALGVPYLGLQRGFDSRYWRESDNSWQVAKTWNPLPSITTIDDLWDHYKSKQIDVGANATTVTPRLGIPTTGTPGSAFRMFGLKITDALDASPFLILTEAAAVTTPKTRFTMANSAPVRVVNEAQGALTWEVIPFWNSADIGSTYRTVFYHANSDGSLAIWGGYDGANARWFVSLTGGGSTVTAYKAASVVRGTMYRFVFRWTGSNAELDLPAYTASVLIDGTKGTDASIPASLRDQVLPTLEIASKSDAQRISGLQRLFHSLQWVPNDTECARLT